MLPRLHAVRTNHAYLAVFVSRHWTSHWAVEIETTSAILYDTFSCCPTPLYIVASQRSDPPFAQLLPIATS